MRKLSDDERDVLHRLYAQLVARSERNSLRSRYAEGEWRLRKLGASIPPGMDVMQVPVSWPDKAVKTFASRMKPEFFSMRAQSSLLDDLYDVYADNDMAYVERLAIASAVRHGVSFVFTSRGDTSMGEPEVLVTVRSALSATAILDSRSGLTRAALEVLDDARVNLYLPGVVLECSRSAGGWDVAEEYPTGTRRVLCAPYVHDATTEKPLGQSRITPTVMGLTDAGVRTLLRQEVSAEFYSAPRMALLGGDSSIFKDESGRWIPGWELLIGAVWGVPDVSSHEDPDMPDNLRRASIEQFSQMSMQPFSDQLRTIASQLSGATSIPMQYLGVVQDSNPTSAAAIEASEQDLVNEVRYQYPSLARGRKSLAGDVLTVLHGGFDDSMWADFRTVEPRWAEPRNRSLTEMSQYVALQVQTGNFQPGTEDTLRQLPLSEEDVKLHAAANRRGNTLNLAERLASAAGQAVEDETVAELVSARGSAEPDAS